ncbi:MAG: WYL domain-containing protein [Actinobacteria bacterium]|nr:WYL domain-containing protein [Actinomycetota bacterium]
MLDRLALDDVREALTLLGIDPPSGRTTALRTLRGAFADFGFVRQQLEQAPAPARAAFLRLLHEGPLAVEQLLGRGWWARGLLPSPLDWLQRRAFVLVDDAGRVVAVDEARQGYLGGGHERSPSVGGVATADAATARLGVEPAGAVVICQDADLLHRAVTLTSAQLRLVAPTVAVSPATPATVVRSLREANLPLTEDLQVAASSRQPALPDRVEQAVGPQAIRTLLDRAVREERQVRLDYYASSRGGAATDRVVDPWQFVDDLLTGWCHLRTAERTFALDRIGRARLLPAAITHRGTAED